jgi:ubiquinone/menaquinone biosynthesis C-methylase UbiE
MARKPDIAKTETAPEGWHGWDEYAPFYDWENARTLGRADVPFWRRLAGTAGGAVLEIGCGTGRIAIPLARGGVSLVGIDRSAPMLARASRRLRALGSTARRRLTLVRADMRALPFSAHHFSAVIAPYGVLQSLVRERDLIATLASVAQVIRPGGLFGLDLVPDVPKWQEYRNRVRMRGRAPGGARVTLIESVRQDRARRLTTFEQTYVRRKDRRTDEHRFTLTFRTISVPAMIRRLEAAGFAVDHLLGDYQGRPWDRRADVWIILAKKV